MFHVNSCVSHLIQLQRCVSFAIYEFNMNVMLSKFTKRHDHNAYKMKNNELGHETNVEKQIKFVENQNSSVRIK